MCDEVQRVRCSALEVLACVLFLMGSTVGCGHDGSSSVSPLVSDPDAEIVVWVVQDSEQDMPTPSLEPVSIYNLTGDYVVATADASPRVVPISFGEEGADPTKDYMLVQLQIEPDFLDDISQVELNIDIGSDGSSEWCYPMEPDPIMSGNYYLKLQPACTDNDRDPLTGDCVVTGTCEGYSGNCREDILTFTLWNDITSLCHGDEEEDTE